MAANKHILVMEVQQIMVEGQARHAKEIEKALGRIQWATSLPVGKVDASTAVGLEEGHHHGGKTTSATSPKSSWRGCGDAGASDLGEA